MRGWACRVALLAMALAVASVPSSNFLVNSLVPGSSVTANWPNPLAPDSTAGTTDSSVPLSPVSL